MIMKIKKWHHCRPGSSGGQLADTAHLLHDSMLPTHFSAERSGGPGQLASVASDSSSSHFTPLMAQESAASRHAASGIPLSSPKTCSPWFG